MAIAEALRVNSPSIKGVGRQPYKAIASALEIIPRTLIQNCGGHVVRALTALRAKHNEGGGGNATWGIDGTTGEIVDMCELNIWEPFVVKEQTVKTAIEVLTKKKREEFKI